MYQPALTLAGSIALLSGVAAAQQVTADVGHVDPSNIRYAGVVDAFTGQVQPAGPRSAGVADPIYVNNSIPGNFYNIEASPNAGAVIIDEGRVPGTSSTNVLGTQESYSLAELQIAYVTNATDPTMGGTGVTLELKIYESFAACGLLENTDAAIGTILLTGMPGSTSGGLAGVLMDVDLSGMNICLRADGDDGYSDGASDLFGWSIQFVDNADGTAGGPFIASQPIIDVPGDGTVFQNPGVFGSGLDTQDAWRQINPSGTVNCLFFGGYPTNTALFGSFYLVVRANLGAECIGCGIGDDRFEPNDDAMTAVPVEPDTYGALISNVDDDWYSITVPPSSGLFVELLFTDATSDLDLILIDAVTGSNLDTGFTSSDNEICQFGNCDPMNSRDVLIRVDNFGGACNEYDMIVEFDALFGDDALEDNDTCINAVPLPLGVTENLIVRPFCNADNGADDGDYYSVTLPAGETLSVDVLFSNDVADIDVVVYDITAGCNGSTVATGFSVTDNESVRYTNTTAGPLDMAVRVDWFAGRSSFYTLVAKVGPEVTVGELICLGVDNSVGSGARVCATGSDVALDDDLTFDVSDLPMNSMGYFIVSQDTVLVANPGGSTGNLCIASFSIGRYSMNVLDSGMTGAVSFSPDLTIVPIAGGGGTSSSAVTSGDRYNWQYWYRDVDGMGAATSNFSDAIGVDFL